MRIVDGTCSRVQTVRPAAVGTKVPNWWTLDDSRVGPGEGHAGHMDDSDIKLVVDCASPAPSVHNTQPWQFRATGDGLEVRADRERGLAYLDPSGRQLHLSCGAAVEFARLAVRDIGRDCVVTVLPDPQDADLLARLAVGEPKEPTDTERALAEAMPRRYTDRSPYDDTPVPAELLS